MTCNLVTTEGKEYRFDNTSSAFYSETDDLFTVYGSNEHGPIGDRQLLEIKMGDSPNWKIYG